MSTVLLATCADLPEGDEDEDAPQLTAACARVGLDARWAVWNDGSVDWQAADLVVIRTTWDYTQHRADFLAWAAGLPAVANPVDVLRWNSDKIYLRELAEAGVPVVPTAWADIGEDIELPGGVDFVVKPAIGAGSLGAARFAADDPAAPAAARAHIAHLHARGRAAMVQPYQHQVDQFGETALVFIDGTYSHTISKAAMLPTAVVHEVGQDSSPDLFVAERITPGRPSTAERALAEQVLANVPGHHRLLYARVDLLPSPEGPVLIELELTEPSLFLRHRDGAAERLARAITRRVAELSVGARGSIG